MPVAEGRFGFVRWSNLVPASPLGEVVGGGVTIHPQGLLRKEQTNSRQTSTRWKFVREWTNWPLFPVTSVLIFKVMLSTCQSNAINSSLVLLERCRTCLCRTFGNSGLYICFKPSPVCVNFSYLFCPPLSLIIRWNVTAAFSRFNASFPLHLSEHNALKCEIWKETWLGSVKGIIRKPHSFSGKSSEKKI